MENASKALIIAGAILISILLISVGIIVMNSINNTVEEGKNSGDSTAIQIVNAKIEGFAGTDKTRQDVKDLISAIRAINGTHDPDVTINNGNNFNGVITGMNAREGYTITFDYGADGVITNATVAGPGI